MVKTREVYKRVISEPAKSRLSRGECPGCGLHKDKWKRRKDWTCCSTKCSKSYYDKFSGMVVFSWADVRLKALERDEYRCVMCKRRPVTKVNKKYYSGLNKFVVKEEVTQYGTWLWIVDKSSLVGDHIIPIALNGAEFDVQNVQTLCFVCHKVKTKEDIKKIAELRRVEKVLQDGKQKKLYVLG